MTDFLDTLHPLILKEIIDRLVNKQDLIQPLLLFFALMFGVAIFRWGWWLLFGRLQHQVADDLRQGLFRHLLQLSPGYHQANPVGATMSVLSQDVNAFRMGVGPGVLVFFDGIFLVGSILPMMIYLSWEWTWKCLILVPLVPFIIQKVEKIIQQRFRKQQDDFSELAGVVQEIIAGMRVIKSFSRTSAMAEYFSRFSEKYLRSCNRTAIVDAAFHPVMDFTVASGCVLLLWIGSNDVIQNALTIGTLYAFQRYIQKLIWPVTALGLGVTMIQQGRGSMDRIYKVLSQLTDIPDHGKNTLADVHQLEVKNLHFKPANHPQELLKDVTFSIQRGEILGITGPIGSGKSILAQCLSRLLPISQDTIFVNGLAAEQVTLASLRQHLCYVPQESLIFSDSVRDNLVMGSKEHFTDQQLLEVLSLVEFRSELTRLPQGLDTQLGERGVNLSGGQKQRLCFARALLRQSSFIIIDDGLSAVDTETESRIMKNLAVWHKAQKQPPGMIIISHRLTTLKLAKNILVLNAGSVEAIGSAEKLEQVSPTFQQIQLIQQDKAHLHVPLEVSG